LSTHGFYAFHSIAAGDFDEDGQIDLIVSAQSNRVAWLRGNGDGSFRSSRNVIP